MLKKHGFGATFYITEGLRFLQDKERYLTWNEVRQLHDLGFEIGNHTRFHKNVTAQSSNELWADLVHIDQCCHAHGIPTPTTFCYPGYSHNPAAVDIVREYGFHFARCGVEPEYPYNPEGGRGPTYDPQKHSPMLIPTTGASGPNWSLDDLVWAVEQARDGKIAVLTFHGVPDLDHPWVHTDPSKFEDYMQYLADMKCTVIALRDLKHYIDV